VESVWKITNKSNPECNPCSKLSKSKSSWRTVRQAWRTVRQGSKNSLHPRAPGGLSARPGGQSARSLKTAQRLVFVRHYLYSPRTQTLKLSCTTSETESQAHSKHSKAPQSETLASPLQIFGLGLGLSKIQTRFKFSPRDSPLLGISWLSPLLSTSITLGA
jgi:hypothetical protein